jgi:hypothetical protein
MRVMRVVVVVVSSVDGEGSADEAGHTGLRRVMRAKGVRGRDKEAPVLLVRTRRFHREE